MQQAARYDMRQAQYQIRAAFDARLENFSRSDEASHPGVQLRIVNEIDETRPPLGFKFIDKSRRGKGVRPATDNFIVGCGQTDHPIGPAPNAPRRKCQPNMGSSRGCEYSRVCDCLEFAAVDNGNITEAERTKYNQTGDSSGLTKRFPYRQKKTLDFPILVDFYMESRHSIYECNPQCRCGPDCKTRLVQKGRTVPLEIFKTKNRGWGTLYVPLGHSIHLR